MVANPVYDTFLKIFLRSYTGLFTEFTRIDEDEVAKRVSLTREETTKRLWKLHQMRVIHYEPVNTKPRITFVKGRKDAREVSISAETYSERKKFATARVDAIKHYVASENRCRSIILLEYFGEQNAERCGRCDVCLERNKLDMSKYEFDNALAEIKPLLKKQRLTLKELLDTIKTNIPEKRIIKTVQWLMDNGKIILESDSEKMSWAGEDN